MADNRVVEELMWMVGRCAGARAAVSLGMDGSGVRFAELYAALESRLRELFSGEPVAWISPGGVAELSSDGSTEVFAEQDYEIAGTLPLYLSPPRDEAAAAPQRDLSDEAFTEAMAQAWRMVDPFKPAGEPGSYARGQDSGIVAALQTVRENYNRARASKKEAVRVDSSSPAQAGTGRCWCASCNPGVVQMFVCPECGCKRCPRATNHEAKCTGSTGPNVPHGHTCSGCIENRARLDAAIRASAMPGSSSSDQGGSDGPAAPKLSWCHHCGEGVTTFCRGALTPCPKGLPKAPGVNSPDGGQR